MLKGHSKVFKQLCHFDISVIDVKKICLLIVFMLLLISFSAISIDARKSIDIKHEKVERAYEWDINLEGHETGGRWDYVIFGEKPDASDLVDQYDVPKCPPPPNGYVRMYMYNNELPYPYTYAWFEYRHSPDIHKTWILKVQWMPQSGNDNAEITLTWEKTGRTEYKSIMLDGINMLREDSYTFTCQAYVPAQFDIVCSRLPLRSIRVK